MFWAILVFLFGIFLSLVIMPAVLAWAWNVALVPLFHFPEMTNIQALAIMIILWIFFGAARGIFSSFKK